MAGARAGVRRRVPADLVDPGGRGSNTRCAARHVAKTHPVLGDGLRLEQVRGAFEIAAALHDADRRSGYTLHPYEVEAPECAADDRDAWLAGFGHRAAEDHRTAHEPHRARW